MHLYLSEQQLLSHLFYMYKELILTTIFVWFCYFQDELLRMSNLNELHDCDGAISYIKVVSHIGAVLIFTIFFPFLVPIVFLGLTLDIIAEISGMFNLAKYVSFCAILFKKIYYFIFMVVLFFASYYL